MKNELRKMLKQNIEKQIKLYSDNNYSKKDIDLIKRGVDIVFTDAFEMTRMLIEEYANHILKKGFHVQPNDLIEYLNNINKEDEI